MAAAVLRGKGYVWNESSVMRDPIAGRTVRRLTNCGGYNEKPTYHTNTAFTEDGEYLIFARSDGARSALCKAHAPSGDITQLVDTMPGSGSWTWRQQCALDQDVPAAAGIDGETACLAPKTRWAVFAAARAIRAVHLDTLEERTLVEDIGPEWQEGVISIAPDETEVLLALVPSHPDVRAGRKPERDYIACYQESGMTARCVGVPLGGGPLRTVFTDEGRHCGHCPHCPADPDLVLIDRDLPPGFWNYGDNGQTPRCWTLRLSTGALAPLSSRNSQRFQVHAAWTWDGRHVLYHGFRREGGYYIGVITAAGDVVQEWEFPEARSYGHVAAAPDRPAIILDGNLSSDLLQYLYYDGPRPRLEVIARHGTEWKSKYAHPHPATDRQGHFLACNVGVGGRSDLLLVTLNDPGGGA